MKKKKITINRRISFAAGKMTANELLNLLLILGRELNIMCSFHHTSKGADTKRSRNRHGYGDSKKSCMPQFRACFDSK